MTDPTRFTLRLALFYGAQFLLLGAYLPYFPVWLDGRGLGPEEVAVVLAATAFARMLFTPLVGFAADRAGDRRRVLKALGWASLGTCLALAFCESFAAILPVTIAFVLSWTSAMPITETVAMSGVRTAGLDYGRMRLWGSLAFVAASVAGGFVVGARGGEAALWLIGVGAAAMAAGTYWLPPPTGRGMLRAAAAIPRVRLRDALGLARSPLFLLFLATAGATQAAHAVYYAFGTLHWREQGIAGGTIGMLWTVGVVAEILLFTVSRRAVAALGAVPLIALAGAAAVLRWTITAFDPPLWLLFSVQALHGLTFGAAHLGAIHFIAQAVPEEYAATAQGLYASVAGGLMMGLAMAAAGPLYAGLGAFAYLPMAGVALAALLGALLLMRQWRAGSEAARTSHPHRPGSGGQTRAPS